MNVFDEYFNKYDNEPIYTNYKFIRELYNYLKNYHYNTELTIKHTLYDARNYINNGHDLTNIQILLVNKIIERHNIKSFNKYLNLLSLAC